MTDQENTDPLAELVERALRDPATRKALVEDPKATIREVLGLEVPAEVEVAVLEESAEKVYVVLPHVQQELSDGALDRVAGGGGSFTRLRVRHSWAWPTDLALSTTSH